MLFKVKRITKVCCLLCTILYISCITFLQFRLVGCRRIPFLGSFFSVGAMSMTARMNHRVTLVDEGRVNSIQKHHKTLIRLLRNNFLPKIGLMVGLVACIAKVNMIFLWLLSKMVANKIQGMSQSDDTDDIVSGFFSHFFAFKFVCQNFRQNTQLLIQIFVRFWLFVWQNLWQKSDKNEILPQCGQCIRILRRQKTHFFGNPLSSFQWLLWLLLKGNQPPNPLPCVLAITK